MSEEKPTKEEQLYIHLVSTYSQSAWVALGKIKNPVTDKTERNLEEAELYIDLLDMLKSKMSGNLSEWEEKFLDASISSLKLNYVEESRKAEAEAKAEEEGPSGRSAQKETEKKNKSEKKGTSSESDRNRSHS